ncbi:hypothetical protein L1285_19420 [Pseudoalteromonas sp. DL2-H2.2]|uniref:hypothetical protein n=1 Tax=Pseudoalteromonas sp. DL2-H2.2 TaxID=2908889 RepID=UPI001F18B38C|nr:hypothetical protein [Pseudoalteromonas sp. DL2-H2.2]MCF2910484.1 hypothetical protein [Pseudoalteromonas sp. DL2-H2.2]
MKANEFYSLSEELGSKYLLPLGFRFNNGGWYFADDNYMLAFELANISHSQSIFLKYLTVVFYNYVKCEDFQAMQPMQYADHYGPVQINPMQLPAYEQWQYTNAHNSRGETSAYFPLYYGGLIGAEPIRQGFFVKKQWEMPKGLLPGWITERGADIVTEDEARELLKKAMINTAEYVFKWADTLTPHEIIRQIEENGDDWFVEKEWVKAYKAHLAAQV